MQTATTDKQILLNEVAILVDTKKKLYSNMPIESAMSTEEKELNAKISAIYSQINQIVIANKKARSC